MIRQLITIAVPLLAPVALYFLYSWHIKRKGTGPLPEDPFSWREIPWIWLLVSGTTLLAITLVISSFMNRTGIDFQYQAPRFEDGKSIPGKFVK